MENPSDDLRTALESAFESSEAPAVDPVVETVVEKPARDEAGKFTKIEQVAAPVVTSQSAETSTVDPDVAPDVVPDVPVKKAPSSWKPDAQAAFDALPPTVQDEVLRRETDYHKGIEGYKSHAHAAQAFEQAVAPYMQTIQSLGVDAPTAVAQLLQADHTLRYGDAATKAQYFSQLAQQYGVDLQQVVNPQPVDPQYAAIQQQLRAQQAELQGWKREQTQREQSVVLSEIDKFAANPANVHFNEVRDDMALLLQSGKAKDLADAYNTAVWMRGDIRQSLIEQQTAAAKKQAIEQSQHARAKAASVSVKGSSPASGTGASVNRSLRDELEAAFADS